MWLYKKDELLALIIWVFALVIAFAELNLYVIPLINKLWIN